MDLKELIEIIPGSFQPNKELPDPDLMLYYGELKDRVLWLEDDIDWNSCQFIIKYIQYLNRHESDDTTPIKLHIMSCGGELSTMFTLYHTIRASKIPVHTINEGMAHSAAFIIFLAGDKRAMQEDALFIAHEGSGRLSGTYRESKRAMAQYDKEVGRMKDIIVDRTKVSLEEVEKHFDEDSDWYINHDEALEIGAITE